VSSARLPDFAYTESYFVEDGPGYDFDSLFARAFDAERFEQELAALEARGLRGSVLDVGCAIGTFLCHAKARGWEVAGVESSEFARREASRRLGTEVVGALAALPAGRRYDVVTLHHVLEHVQDPVAFLAREVAPRVGRLLLLEVPNFASLAAQVEGPRWKDFRPEQHVHHFEPPTLRGVVEAAGFEVSRVYTLAEPLWSLRATLRTLRSLGGLVASRSFDAGDLPPPAAVSDWRPPRGLRRAVVGTSRMLLRPLVAWIEWTLRAGRLVLEAQVGRAGS
jgi:SAM-dependent methyltransferase